MSNRDVDFDDDDSSGDKVLHFGITIIAPLEPYGVSME